MIKKNSTRTWFKSKNKNLKYALYRDRKRLGKIDLGQKNSSQTWFKLRNRFAEFEINQVMENWFRSNFRIEKLDLNQGIKISKMNNWFISNNRSPKLDLSQILDSKNFI